MSKLRIAGLGINLTFVFLLCAPDVTFGHRSPSHVTPSDAEVASWIEQLDDDAFSTRNRAEQNLRSVAHVEKSLINKLANAAESDSAEVRTRARAIIRHWSQNATLAPRDDYTLGLVLKKLGMTEIIQKRKEEALAWLDAFQEKQNGNAVYDDGFGESDSATLGFWGMELNDEDADELARHVARLPNIHGIQIDSTYGRDQEDTSQVSPRAMAAFQHTSAQWLWLNVREVNNETLAAVGRMSALEHLELEDGQYTDAGLAQLAGLTKLTRISLNGAPLTGAGLVHLKDCQKLSILILANTKRLDTDRLAVINQFKKLDALNLSKTNVIGAEFAQFDELQLTALILHGTAVNDEGLAGVAQLKGLTDLDLSGTQVTDAGLEQLAPLKKLEELELADTEINGVGLAHLRDCKNLRMLDVEATKFNDHGLAQLKELDQLERLNLSATEIFGTGFVHLRDLEKLSELDLSQTKVNDAAMKSIAQLQGLSKLYLIDTEISDAATPELTKLKNLTLINVRGTKITASGIGELEKKLPHCKILGGPD